MNAKNEKIIPRILRQLILFCFISWLTLVPLNAASTIQPFNFPLKVKTGDTVTATCVVVGDSEGIIYTWKKDGKTFSSQGNYEIIGQAASVIIIKSVTIENSGNFTCVANGPNGQDSHTASLRIEAPPEWVTKSKDMTAQLQEKLYIHCETRGTPNPSIQWKKITEAGHKDILKDQRTNILPNGTLIISDVKYEDVGDYICTADNGVKNAITHRIRIEVRGMEFCIL